ncbi:UNVERIFIED_CONTAM: hypothetical protein BJ099_10619 [Lysinibacillus xylanilyticus]
MIIKLYMFEGGKVMKGVEIITGIIKFIQCGYRTSINAPKKNDSIIKFLRIFV